MSDYAVALGEPTRHNGWVRCGKSGGWIEVRGFDFNTDEWNWNLNLKTPTLVRLLNKVFKYINVPGVCIKCGDAWVFEYWYRNLGRDITDPLRGKVCCDRCRSDDRNPLLPYMFPKFHSDIDFDSCRRVRQEAELGYSPQRLDFLAELQSV